MTTTRPEPRRKGLMTVREVAILLGVCERTVWRLAARGQLPQPIRYSRKLVRWSAEQVERYLQTLSCGPRPA
jgi:excisionase family DNA binding protein